MENVYYKLNERELKIFEKVEEITGVDYEKKGEFIPVSSLFSAVWELKDCYEKKEEEIEDLKKDIEDNYTPIPYEDQI